MRLGGYDKRGVGQDGRAEASGFPMPSAKRVAALPLPGQRPHHDGTDGVPASGLSAL